MASKLKIMVGLHGQTYSNSFLVSWSMLLNTIHDKHDLYLIQADSSHRFVARHQMMGINISSGTKPEPFQGVDYDVFLMIDPKIIFTPESVIQLVERCAAEKNACSGLYYKDPSHYFVSVDGKTLLNKNEVEQLTDQATSVQFTGLGFFACHKSVIDALEFPYFQNVLSEELVFCKSIRDHGVSVVLYKDIVVHSEMNITL